MVTPASNFMEICFLSRNKCLLKWALRIRLFPFKLSSMSSKSFGYKVHELSEKFVDFDGTDAEASYLLHSEGFMSDAALRKVLPVIREFNQPCGVSHHERRLFLLKLQLKYLMPDKRTYESIVSEARESYPGSTPEDKQLRSQYYTSRWPVDCPPPKEMSPLPVCHTSATFVQYDKKCLEEVFPSLKTHIEGPWGYTSFFRPYSYEANIPCLKNNNTRSGKSEASMIHRMRHMHLGLPCPWLVACSFRTDGLQVKLLLHTVEQNHPTVSGFKQLPLAGYRGDGKEHELHTILQRGTGVYPLRNVTGTIDDLHDVEVTSLDPGQVLVVDGPRSLGHAFTKENVVELMNVDEENRCTYSGEEYREISLGLLSEQREASRRRGDYAVALSALPRRKTAVLQEFVAYCKVYAAQQCHIWKEILYEKRRHWKFERFRAVQKAVEDVAERVAPAARRCSRRIIMFGAASFKAAKGCASAPCKKIVRAICLRAAVIMVPEAWTSQTCPGCNKRLKDGTGYRTKLYTTALGCLLHPESPTVELARDAVGGLNIGYRAMTHFAGIMAVTMPPNT